MPNDLLSLLHNIREEVKIPSVEGCGITFQRGTLSVQCNGGLLPDILLLTLCDSIGEPF